MYNTHDTFKMAFIPQRKAQQQISKAQYGVYSFICLRRAKTITVMRLLLAPHFLTVSAGVQD